MTKTIKILSALMAFIFLSSFTYRNVSTFIGTYGVSASDPAQIKLTINSDHSFSYQDFSNSNKKIDLKGNWIIKGRKVILQGNNTNNNFHKVWSFDKDGQVARSRKGLTFYRLCKIDT